MFPEQRSNTSCCALVHQLENYRELLNISKENIMKLGRKFAKTFIVVLPFLTAILLASPAALAATAAHPAPGPVAAHLAPHIHPNCNAVVWVSQLYPNPGIVNQTVYTQVSWSCAAWFDTIVRIFWGDGSNDTYTCVANCGSGTTWFTHSTYSRARNYTITPHLDGQTDGNGNLEIITN
jgi:hypothetical protein